jgi:hypothetical protein
VFTCWQYVISTNQRIVDGYTQRREGIVLSIMVQPGRAGRNTLRLPSPVFRPYSQLFDEVEWGYNRDHEQLPQINLCLLMGARSRLPIYQTIYSGSLKDVSTLKTTLAKMDAVTSDKPLLLVMDKGFFSTKNINDLLDRSLLRFIIAVASLQLC